MTFRSTAATVVAAAAAFGPPACTSRDATPATTTSAGTATTTACDAPRKLCEGACVAGDSPATGCAAPSCAPCEPSHASAACTPAGDCAVGECQSGFGDCDGDAKNGCEAALPGDPANCGACANACAVGEICQQGACTNADAAALASWIAERKGGFCHAEFNELMHLCGDVEFCFDQTLMRPYPEGLALDLGFDWDGQDASGYVTELGGDCDEKYVLIRIDASDGGAVVSAYGPMVESISAPISPGRHLLSYRVTATNRALFLDGVLAAEGGGPLKTPELWHDCGPGFVLGERAAYWWEQTKPDPIYLRFAPFFVHLRDEVKDASVWSFDEATKPGARTVVLFDETGAQGSTWKATKGAFTGVGKNGSTWVADTRKDCLEKP